MKELFIKYRYSLIFIVLLLGVLFNPISEVKAQEFHSLSSGLIIGCGDGKIIILDPNDSDLSSVVWKWNVKDVFDQVPELYHNLLVPLDECKPIDDNKRILVTSSGGATAIVDVKSKSLEFYAKTPKAHSAELLPGGYIAVANSTHPEGNSLELYHRSESEKVIESDSLYSGHGVIWNDSKNILFALGYNELKAYAFDEKESPKLTLLYVDTLPTVNGHDLSFVDDNRLLISTDESAYLYDLQTRVFNDFTELGNISHLKSINYNPVSENIIYTKAEISWWTHNIYSKNPSRVFHIPDISLYKVRVVKE